jgi:PiT family inorganic phosphate transporter
LTRGPLARGLLCIRVRADKRLPRQLGALLVGTAVADTIAGIVTVSGAEAIVVIGSGALAAVLWNLLTWWRGLPSSSAHALVGGLVGAALVEGGIAAVQLGGLNGWRPVGVFGVLIALAVSPESRPTDG